MGIFVTMTPPEQVLDARLQQLIDQGEEIGCVNLSELSDVVKELDLDDDQAQEIHERIEARGIDVSDDCGRGGVAETRYANGEIAQTPTDVLQLFLNEVSRHPLLTADEEIELAKRIARA